ncbi:MAG: radical SAM protein [Clostridia bacterium]|nr:radical SAM protein [Clostridia bacterium]
MIKYTKEFKAAVKHPELKECDFKISNIGWSLGNACPCNCKQCYSLSVRNKGMDISKGMVDRVVSQIDKLHVKTVNLGGNEPWYTNSIGGKSILPYILQKLNSIGADIGITTAGITLMNLYNENRETFHLLNDVDISLDSPIKEEHDKNRGAYVYDLAIKSLEIAKKTGLERTIIICAMKWNFTRDRIDKFLDIAKKYGANIRFNMLKPVKKEHIDQIVDVKTFYENYIYLLSKCETVDITEPRLSGLINNKKSSRCPCGRTSLRIHSITPDGKIPVSPCVYIHDYKAGDLLQDDIFDIINSEPFKEFRRRNENPEVIEECRQCEKLEVCGGGCTANAYLWHYWTTGESNIYVKEPNCPKDCEAAVNLDATQFLMAKTKKSLVHMDYLCTWIGRPL